MINQRCIDIYHNGLLIIYFLHFSCLPTLFVLIDMKEIFLPNSMIFVN